MRLFPQGPVFARTSGFADGIVELGLLDLHRFAQAPDGLFGGLVQLAIGGADAKGAFHSDARRFGVLKLDRLDVWQPQILDGLCQSNVVTRHHTRMAKIEVL